MPRDEATLLDILTAAQLAVQFRGDLTKDEFRKDLKTRSAVLHQLLIIGEAVKRLSAELRSEHPEIPWKSVAGMRDQLIHAYDRVDLDEVWTTLTRDLPHLVQPFGSSGTQRFQARLRSPHLCCPDDAPADFGRGSHLLWHLGNFASDGAEGPAKAAETRSQSGSQRRSPPPRQHKTGPPRATLAIAPRSRLGRYREPKRVIPGQH